MAYLKKSSVNNRDELVKTQPFGTASTSEITTYRRAIHRSSLKETSVLFSTYAI